MAKPEKDFSTVERWRFSVVEIDGSIEDRVFLLPEGGEIEPLGDPSIGQGVGVTQAKTRFSPRERVEWLARPGGMESHGRALFSRRHEREPV